MFVHGMLANSQKGSFNKVLYELATVTCNERVNIVISVLEPWSQFRSLFFVFPLGARAPHALFDTCLPFLAEYLQLCLWKSKSALTELIFPVGRSPVTSNARNKQSQQII